MIYCNIANEQNKFNSLLIKDYTKVRILALNQVRTRKNQAI